ncbi:MAG: uracil-DNA glycosylase [Rhodocyclaceae bacterium]|nr:uracil-DNA glycosylase [Rhodocyclaceae bacterium]
MNPQRHHILRELGIGPQWRLRTSADTGAVTEVPAAAVAPEAPVANEAVAAAPMRRALPALETPASAVVGSAVDAAHLDWDALAGAVAECRACSLCEARKQAVLGVGDRQADWLFVGEGPGAEEDERGEPFVGQAGKLLDAMLAAIDLRRDQNVYITNSVKCRPPGNRTPEPAEIAACHPYLERQIALLQPKLIVALGRPAAQTLLGREVKIADVRGQLLDYRGIPLIVTYHPAYLLRNLHDKARTWEDLCFARRSIAG